MIGATLSRWTMSFFSVALVALIVALVLMAAGTGYPSEGIADAGSLIVVHVTAIGWLSLLMCGALLQFLPVLVAHTLYSDALAWPALLALVVGLVALVLAFLQFGGILQTQVPYFAAAAVLLIAGFGLILWNLGATLLAAEDVPLPVWFVIAGLVAAVFTVGLGAVFATALGGGQAAWLVTLTAAGIPLHAIAGLGGWLTFTAMGVSYRLLAMFMLSPELKRQSTRIALVLGAAALAVAVVGGIVVVLANGNLMLALTAALVLAVGALVPYGMDVVFLYRKRRRPVIELNSRMAGVALANLAALAVLVVVLAVFGQLGNQAGAVVFFAAFGWLTGLGLSQLFKIVAFMTWLETYGPVMGRMPTPRVQDLVVEKRALKWFWTYHAGTWAATLALLFGLAIPFRICVVVMLAGTLGLVAQFLRTRRLLDIDAAKRLPEGTRQPQLFVSNAAKPA
ncbi:MAG: hypothetical protein H3C51_02365 [Rubellimicrobium sp.]|nr:hypothetical protein [Rubellimicrobium sp.]